jgi:hypothetical protein
VEAEAVGFRKKKEEEVLTEALRHGGAKVGAGLGNGE